ncbi:hypothetical protein FHETE_5195 [Fusarium heterosporum]|uniref:Pinin/SDK/MemA protein domain-containing protein n=1 Tax=Fusarium heterosporum TaxID=42747 RepID=A0A8H5WSR3_FUSHE|nr:hypothetical protein FHETE_5195 [Fusarium heterosporum]
MATENELRSMNDIQPKLQNPDSMLSPSDPDTGPAKRKASENEDHLSPKRIKHDDHFREATDERPRREPLQDHRDSYGDSAGVDADRRKLATQEEKKRGKRLFGGLLSTLSQTAGGTQHKRRLEIERRQQERIHKQSIEDDKVREEKRARLTEIRKGEQIVFDEEVMRNKHAKMLAMAQYLRTKSRPQIYYLPWKLTEEQEDAIDAQIQQVKDTVEREVGAFNARKDRQTSRGRQSPASAERIAASDGKLASEFNEPKVVDNSGPSLKTQEVENQEHHGHHHDESADVLEEAEEDTVIY